MSPEIRELIGVLLCTINCTGSVLEIGATPESMLLDLPQLAHAQEKIGINFDPAVCDFQIQHGNANHMPQFKDGQFSLVLCNSVLEHDLCFWKTLSEVSRVTSSSGVVIIGVPSYNEMGSWRILLNGSLFSHLIYKSLSWLIPESVNASSITLGLHDFPSDYYRFSANALKVLLLEFCQSVEVHELMQPPRVIAVGRMPRNIGRIK